MTPDEIISICEDADAEDWLYWTYAPWARSGAVAVSPVAAARGKAPAHFARAVYRGDVAIGLAWGVAGPGEAGGHDWPREFAEQVLSPCWIDLLYNDLVIERYLAVSLLVHDAVLPAPTVERRADGSLEFWVSRDEFAVVRLANAIDPACCDFDCSFVRSGIRVR